MQEKNKYCCEIHVDLAFDDFLVENGTFPHLQEYERGKCFYCNSNSKYLLALPIEYEKSTDL